jgi:hypothetical protein
MGDSGEGLVDNEARIQERMEELQRNRQRPPATVVRNPESTHEIESLQLARKNIARSLETTTNEARKKQLTTALADIDRRIALEQTKL